MSTFSFGIPGEFSWCYPNKQTNKQTNKQINKQTNKQTNKQINTRQATNNTNLHLDETDRPCLLISTVKPKILNTSKEFMKCRLDNFLIGFILFYVILSIRENK